jgi:hypothetical protein
MKKNYEALKDKQRKKASRPTDREIQEKNKKVRFKNRKKERRQ